MTNETPEIRPTSRLRHAESRPDGGSMVDQMGECSFPASDPPAVWTWEVTGGSGQRSPHVARTHGVDRSTG